MGYVCPGPFQISKNQLRVIGGGGSWVRRGWNCLADRNVLYFLNDSNENTNIRLVLNIATSLYNTNYIFYYVLEHSFSVNNYFITMHSGGGGGIYQAHGHPKNM